MKPAEPGTEPSGPPAPQAPHAPASRADRPPRFEESASALGRSWAEACRHELEREGRSASGGWPGTLSEARARVGVMIAGAGKGRGAARDVTEAEREAAVRTAYRSARDEWRRHSAPEDP